MSPILPFLRNHGLKAAWITVFVAVLLWSAYEPLEYFTWALEAAPALIGFVLLLLTYRAFPLTPLLYLLILVHVIVLLVGAHYTYAEVPLFEELKPILGFERNNYDKVGHFMQGLVPAIICREILIRLAVVRSAGWRNFLILAVCLAFSALYELMEWLVAISSGESAAAFLGTQGFIWDTQTDMAFALLGALMALILLSRLHDLQLARLDHPGASG